MTHPVTPPPYTPGGAVPPQPGGVPPQYIPPAQPGAVPPPYGAVPQPHGAVPPPPGAVPPATEGLGPAPEKPKSGAGKKVVGIIVMILIALVVIGLKSGLRNLFSDDDKTKDVAVGECITDSPDAKQMKPVACTDATAAHKVAGKVDGITESGFEADKELDLCKAYPTTEGALWSGETGGKGYVLCLEPVKK